MKRAWWIVATLLVPLASHADHRFVFEPSLQVREVDDDNLNFSIETPMRDRVHRVTPTLALRFDSPRWRLTGAYSIDSERYANHSTLNNDRARARGGASIRYQAGPRVVLALNSAYLDTNTLGDLNADNGLSAARVRGRRLSFEPSATFRISPRLTATAAASSVTTNVIAGAAMRAQSQRFGLERRVAQRDLFSLDYEHSQLVFTGANAQSINSHALHAGWSHDLGAHDRVVVHVGPRITNQTRLADVSASLTHRWRFSSMGLSLTRNQTTVIGYAGAVDTESLQAIFSFAPNRRLTAYSEPAIIRSTHHELEGTVYRMVLGLRYAIASLIDADIAYNRDMQNGAIDPLRANAKISHATVSVGFVTRWNNPDGKR
jgi:hypothetical protein